MAPARIIAFANQKGGVGKTTIAILIATALAREGKRVLVCDLDPQANATSALVPKVDGIVQTTMSNLWTMEDGRNSFIKGSAAKAIVPSDDVWPESLDLIASDINLASREQEQWEGREFRLRTVMAGVEEDYDYIILDCPPNLGQLTINALVYTDEIIIVSSAALWGLEGVHRLQETIERLRGFYNPSLKILSMIMNMANVNRIEDRERFIEAQDTFGDVLYPHPCSYATLIESANGASHPLYDMGGKGDELFGWATKFAKERIITS